MKTYRTFRAVIATDSEGGELRLTEEADAHLDDTELLTLGIRNAEEDGIDVSDSKISVVEWVE